MEILNILKIIFRAYPNCLCDRDLKIDAQDFDFQKEFWQVLVTQREF